MSAFRKNRSAVFAAGLPLALLAAGILVFVTFFSGQLNGGKRAEAIVDPNVNFSISSTGCDSGGTPTAKCTVPLSGTFTVAFNVVSAGGLSYTAYDVQLHYTSGLTTSAAGLHQQGAGNWPDCGVPASDFNSVPNQLNATCAFGPGASPSTYVGSMLHLDFTCGASDSTETITLDVGAESVTDLIPEDYIPHGEASAEALTVNCGAGHVEPTATPTPCEGPCPTATFTPTPTITQTPTNTPIAPTATSTPAGECGDANGDGSVNSLDAFWVLQYDAGLVDHVARPELADLNHDGHINSIDASVILQITAGLYHCS